jgi:hypothetical protein
MYKLYGIRVCEGRTQYIYDVYKSLTTLLQRLRGIMHIYDRLNYYRRDVDFTDDIGIIYEFTSNKKDLTKDDEYRLQRIIGGIEFDQIGTISLKDYYAKYDLEISKKIYISCDGSLWDNSTLSGLRETTQPIGTIFSCKKVAKLSQIKYQKGSRRLLQKPQNRKSYKLKQTSKSSSGVVPYTPLITTKVTLPLIESPINKVQ